MSNLPKSKEIEKALQPNPWNLGNQVLYDLCESYFEHDDDEKILAKVWLIGRAYSAAIERRKNKSGINEDFYIKKVAPAFKNSKLDEYLEELKTFEKLTKDNLKKILTTHCYLTKLISRKNFTGQNKSSFSSKYLHFHLPHLFFILDSRVEKALRHYRSYVPADLKHIPNVKSVNKRYATFVCKCLDLKEKIEETERRNLTIRQFDNLLIEIANKKASKQLKNKRQAANKGIAASKGP